MRITSQGHRGDHIKPDVFLNPTLMNHIKLKYQRHEGREMRRSHGVYALNVKTGKTFYIGAYSTKGRAIDFGQKELDRKIKNPSTEFKRFIKPNNSKIYMGVFIYGQRGCWHCELIDDKFKTLADIKFYIKEYLTLED